MNEIIKIGLQADPAGLIKGFAQAEGAIAKFGAGVKAASAVIKAAGQAMEVVEAKMKAVARKVAASGVGISLSFAGMAAKASSFQKEMLNIQSIARMTEGDFNRTGSSILNMSRKLGSSATTIAQGFYDVQSSGFAGADALYVTEQAALAASAGMTQTAVSARAITAVLNSYGLEAGKASDVSDILFKTVDLGVITFEEMASGMGDWVGMAATVGVAADEGAAAIAAMTLAGVSAAEAGTSLSRLLQEFIQPGEALSRVVADLGYDSALTMLQTNGLEQSMAMLSGAVGGTAEGFTAMFPEIRAARGAMALAANDGENYARVAGQITDENQRAGAALQAFEIQAAGLGHQWDKLKASLGAAAIEFGQKLVPAVTMVVSGITTLVNILGKIPGPIQTLIAYLGTFAAVLTGVVGLFALFALKGLVFRVVMGYVASTTATAAASATVFSGALGRASAMATKAASSNGILAASFRAVAAASGTAAGSMGISGAGLSKYLGVIGLVIAGYAAYEMAANSAANAGRALATDFINSIDTETVEGFKKGVQGIADEIERVRELQEAAPKHAFWNNDHEKATAQLDELTDKQKEMERQWRAIETAMVDAYQQSKNGEIIDRNSFNSIEEYNAAIDQMLGKLDTTKDEVVSRMTRISDAFDIDPNQSGYQFMLDMNEALAIMDGTSSAGAENYARALSDLGNAAEDTGGRIEKLGDILDSLFNQEFGLEEAVDNTQSSINDLYETVQRMADDGTLERAMDPESFHEDALSLRSDMRDLTQDYIDQSLAWAETQENMTGGDFLNNLQAQADAFRQAGRDAGLSEPMIERYASMIEQAAQDREIAVRFNESDLAATEFVTQALIADLGLIPENVTVAMEIYKEDGEAALREYMDELGVASTKNVENMITVLSQQALADLDEYASHYEGIDRGVLVNIIETSIKEPEKLPALLDSLSLADEDYQAIVEIIGAEDGELAVGILNEMLTDIDKEWVPLVTVQPDPALAAIDNVQAALNKLERTYSPKIQPVVVGGQVLYNPSRTNDAHGSIHYANGGMSKEMHYAQIARPTAKYRVWNEPETGGEAYIPMAPSKRRRSQTILAEVARQFGATVSYAAGGYWEYDPVLSKPVWRPYNQNPSTTNMAGRFGNSGGSGSGGGRGRGGGGSSAAAGSSSNMDQLAKEYELGELAIDDYLAKLEEAIKGYKKYSDEWMDLHDRIQQISKESLAQQKQRNEIMVALNEMNETDYLGYLARRIAAEEKYTDDWWSLTQERMALEEEMAQRQAGVESMMLDLGIITEEQYKDMLRSRLTTLRKFSEEWYRVWKELNSFNVDLVVDLEDAQRRYDDALADQLRAQEDYNQAMEDSVADFRKQIQNELQAARDVVTGPIEALGNATQQFGGDLDASRDEILEYYRHVTEGARRFRDTMGRLENAGLADSLLEQLYAAGPEALNVATAFEEMVQTGQIDEVNRLANEIKNIADQTGDLYMSTRGQGIVDNFGLEPAVSWADDFGVSLDNVNIKAMEMASNFGGVRRALEVVEEVAKEVADALEALNKVKIEKAAADTANQQQKDEAAVSETPVEKLYRELFGRAGDPSGNAYWTSLYAGGMSLDAIKNSMRNSPEYLKAMYERVLGRAADAGGLAYWTQQMNAGLSVDAIEMYLKQSDEYRNRKQHGGFLAGGRSAWVGETGPEIIRAPAGGAMVYPNGHGSMGGGDTVMIERVEIGAGNNVTPADVRREMTAAFSQMKRDILTGSRR